MWNYLSVPFLFIGCGFATRELEDHTEAGEIWRVLEVTYVSVSLWQIATSLRT